MDELETLRQELADCRSWQQGLKDQLAVVGALTPKAMKVVQLAIKVGMTRPHDGSQLDADLEELLLEAQKVKA